MYHTKVVVKGDI